MGAGNNEVGEGDHMDDASEDSCLDSLDELVASPAINYSQLTVVRLKELCREKGLPVSGKKDVLIDRLEHDRKLELEVIEKQIREKRQGTKRKWSAKIHSRPAPKAGENDSFTTDNIYSQALPQMNASAKHQNSRTQSGSGTTIDPAVGAHLERLIKEYLAASGGTAGIRDIGRYLAANGDSQKGNVSALTELKSTYGSLLSYIRSREHIFSVSDNGPSKNGLDHDFVISCYP